MSRPIDEGDSAARERSSRSAGRAAVFKPVSMEREAIETVEALDLAALPPAAQTWAGFRVWRLIEGELRSPYRAERWDQPVLHASCHAAARRHRAPHPACRCGIYVSDVPNLQFSQVDFRGVTGVVTVCGDLVRDRKGVRAEYAKVAALGLYSHWTRRQRDAVRAVARRLEADVVDLHDLADAAGRYGCPLHARSGS